MIKGFKIRDQLQVASSMLWSSLQSLQLALRLKREGLKDLDIVASELVKFLLTNSGYGSIERLERDVKEIPDMLKSIKGATTSATTASNKIDELKKTIVGLEKRLTKVDKSKQDKL